MPRRSASSTRRRVRAEIKADLLKQAEADPGVAQSLIEIQLKAYFRAKRPINGAVDPQLPLAMNRGRPLYTSHGAPGILRPPRRGPTFARGASFFQIGQP